MSASAEAWAWLADRYWEQGATASGLEALRQAVRGATGNARLVYATRLFHHAASLGESATMAWVSSELAEVRSPEALLMHAIAEGVQGRSEARRRMLAQAVEHPAATPSCLVEARLAQARAALASSDAQGARALANEAWHQAQVVGAGVPRAIARGLAELALRLELTEAWFAPWPASLGLAALAVALYIPAVATRAARQLEAQWLALAEPRASDAVFNVGDARVPWIAYRAAHVLGADDGERVASWAYVEAIVAAPVPKGMAPGWARACLALVQLSKGGMGRGPLGGLLRRASRHAGADANVLLALATRLQAAQLDDAARGVVMRVLVASPHSLEAWRLLARMVVQAPLPSDVLRDVLAPLVPSFLSWTDAMVILGDRVAELARVESQAGMLAHGHRVKNVMGMLAAQLRSLRRVVARNVELPPVALEGALQTLRGVGQGLAELELDASNLYGTWAAYLRAMQSATPQPAWFALIALIEEMAGQLRLRFPDVVVELAADEPEALVYGDRRLLAEAFENILVNAAEATPPRGRVGIRVRAEGATRNAWGVEIFDDGPGIAADQLPKLFAPGFTTKEHGSGVGLVIAQRVVLAHHGQVRVTSEPGRGTTVTITLPIEGMLGGEA